MIEAHKLTRSLTITRRTTTQDRYGAAVETWSDVATVRAQRLDATSRDFLRAGGEGEEGLAIYRIRWRADIGLDDQVADGESNFEIVELIELGRRKGLELRVRSRS